MFIIHYLANIVNLGVLNPKSRYEHVGMINQSKVWFKKKSKTKNLAYALLYVKHLAMTN